MCMGNEAPLIIKQEGLSVLAYPQGKDLILNDRKQHINGNHARQTPVYLQGPT